ncbi:MAG: hypothetical protein WC998_04310 [Candidatus Paceibacterota bacterium]|jgi:hypothetical protein
MINSSQVFLTILLVASTLAAYYFKDTEFYSSLVLGALAVIMLVLIIVYRNRQTPSQIEDASSTEITEYPPTMPISPRLDLLPLDAKLGRLLDKCIDEATTTAKLNIKIHLPLPEEIMYRGEKVKVEGGLTVEMNSNSVLTKTETATSITQPKITQRELAE